VTKFNSFKCSGLTRAIILAAGVIDVLELLATSAARRRDPIADKLQFKHFVLSFRSFNNNPAHSNNDAIFRKSQGMGFCSKKSTFYN
jgi:hypothetical protein